MNPRTQRKLRDAALAFACIGIWLTAIGLVPRAVDQRLASEQAAAAPSIEALAARDAEEAANAGKETGDGQTSVLGQSGASGKAVKKVIKARVTTYQAVPEQTDSTPCITASGLDLCDPVFGLPPFGVVANNCLPFGTEVEIRGEQYFVHDRMKKGTACNVFDVLTAGDNWATPEGTTEPVTVL